MKKVLRLTRSQPKWKREALIRMVDALSPHEMLEVCSEKNSKEGAWKERTQQYREIFPRETHIIVHLQRGEGFRMYIRKKGKVEADNEADRVSPNQIHG